VAGEFRPYPDYLEKTTLWQELTVDSSGEIRYYAAAGPPGTAARVNQVAGWMAAGIRIQRLWNLEQAYFPEYSTVTDPLVALLDRFRS
jgi:hypothetical protein